jgi:hypothetical protein
MFQKRFESMFHRKLDFYFHVCFGMLSKEIQEFPEKESFVSIPFLLV